MSFIRRADGTVVHTGGHVGSRGSLESIRHGGAEDFSEGIPEEDREWEIRALASAVTLGDSFNMQWHEEVRGEFDTYDLDLVERLWGVYEGGCPHLRKEFDEGHFSPSGR